MKTIATLMIGLVAGLLLREVNGDATRAATVHFELGTLPFRKDGVDYCPVPVTTLSWQRCPTVKP